MKGMLFRMSGRIDSQKIILWVKLIAFTGSAQILVQAIGFVSGILVLRLLPIDEYALYTIANTMLGTMTVLADGGIAAGTISQGGKVWQDPQKLGAVIATGMSLRKKFSVASLIISTPILIYLLVHHNASWLMTILIVLALIPAFISNLTDSLLEIAPKLKQDIVSLQKNQVSVNLARLFALFLTLFIFPWTVVAILASGIPRIWGNIKLRAISSRYADWQQHPDPVIQKDILIVVKRVLPTSIYYCVSGQITIWIITIFGTTKALAQIGGLGRFSMVFTVFSMLFTTLISPRFSRLPAIKNMILKRFVFIQLILFVFCSLILLGVYYFSNNILWVLGSNFKALTAELGFVAIGGCMGLISSSTNQLLSVRGLIVPPFIFLSFTIAVQVGTAFLLPLNELTGVLLYGILTTSAMYLVRVSYFLFSFKSDFDFKKKS